MNKLVVIQTQLSLPSPEFPKFLRQRITKYELTTSAPLPKIDIFMTQRCSIPLLRCDFDSALKAANSHNKEMHEATGNTSPVDKPPDEVQPDKMQQVQTSSRP